MAEIVSLAVHERQPPSNLEAEQALLGALLVHNRALERVQDYLKSEHFAAPAHQRIYGAIGKLVERHGVVTHTTLHQYFAHDEEMKALGGVEYLAALVASTVTIVNVDAYARTICDLYLRRVLIEVGFDLVNSAHEHDLDTDPRSYIEEAEGKLFELGRDGELKGDFVEFSKPLAEAVRMAEAAHKRDGRITGVTTGLIDMDRKLGGLQKSDLVILAGRPSMGKTALATNMAFRAAETFMESQGKEGAGVAFFSLEMSAAQLATRILADISGVPSEKIRRGELKSADFDNFALAVTRLARLPLYIDDTPALSVQAVHTRARRLMARYKNLGLIVVDYLQLLRATSSRAAENRVLEVSEITRNLKAIAKDLNVPVLALSQLSRAVEQREDKRPQLSDLRESGSIEQDSDVVMFVYRGEYYLEREEPSQRDNETQDKFNERYARWAQLKTDAHGLAEIIIGKQRHGPIGTVTLKFDGEFTRFSDLDTHHQA